MYRATIRRMSNSRQFSLSRIRRASRFLRWLFLAVAIVLAPLRVVGWLIYDQHVPIDEQVFLYGLSASVDPDVLTHQVDLQQRLWAMAASALPTAFCVASFVTLAHLFHLYAQGQIFTARVVATIRRLGFLIVGVQFADMIYQALCSIALTMHNGVGHRMVVVGFGSNHVELLLVAAIVIFSSWVMDEGRRMQAELDLTI
jgi:hypothetical protein